MRALDEMKARFRGRRVKHVGISGRGNGPTGKVWRVTSNGVWVTHDDGSGRFCYHPEDLRVI